MTTNTTKPTRIERGSQLRWVRISDMKVSPAAQREFRPHWKDRLVATFDIAKMGVPTVNNRDGSYFVVDGQHTTEALRDLGFSDEQVQCWYYEGLSEAEEANLFLVLNDRLPVNVYDKFNVGIVAERELPSDVNRIVRALGMTVSKAKGEGSIGCVATLQQVYRAGGPKCLARSLQIIRDSFGDPGYQASIIKGLGLVCQRYNGELDDAVAIAKLGGMRAGASALMSKAVTTQKQTRKPIGECVAAAVVDVINSGTGKKLASWWKIEGAR